MTRVGGRGRLRGLDRVADRAPTLADRLLAGADLDLPAGATAAERRRVEAWARGLVRSARRYRFDVAAAHAVYRLGVEHPEVVLRLLASARCPFDPCWIEWDSPARHVFDPDTSEDRGVVEGTVARGVVVQRLAPDRALYRLIPMGAADATQAVLAPGPVSFLYDLDGPAPVLPPREDAAPLLASMIGEAARDLHRAAVVGGNLGLPHGAGQEEREEREAQVDALRAHVALALTPEVSRLYQPGAGEGDAVLAQFFVQALHVWTTTVAAIALLNQRDMVFSDAVVPRAQGSVRGRRAAFLEHRVVALRLPPRTVVREVVRRMAQSIPRRRHEVAGHWAHLRQRYPGEPGCDHGWVCETANRQVCAVCGHKRVWRPDHERGDARLGYVTKEYDVTSGQSGA